MCFIHSNPYEIRVLTVIIVIILIIIIIIIRAQVFCQMTAVELVYWTDYQLPNPNILQRMKRAPGMTANQLIDVKM